MEGGWFDLQSYLIGFLFLMAAVNLFRSEFVFPRVSELVIIQTAFRVLFDLGI